MGLDYDLCEKDINLCVFYILASSFLYYHSNIDSPIQDTEFDAICKLALENWQNITHSLKHLISEDDLRAGTLYNLEWYKYPEGLKRCAMQWVKLGTKEYHRQRWSI